MAKATLKASELRDMAIEELQALHPRLSNDLFQLLNQKKLASNKIEQAHRIPLLRKDIARVLTVLRERNVI